jgi:hypothetical protein
LGAPLQNFNVFNRSVIPLKDQNHQKTRFFLTQFLQTNFENAPYFKGSFESADILGIRNGLCFKV